MGVVSDSIELRPSETKNISELLSKSHVTQPKPLIAGWRVARGESFGIF